MTRGCFGFRRNGTDKLVYSNSDSYPKWLGREFCSLLRDLQPEEMGALYDHLRLYNLAACPTAEEIQEMRIHGLEPGWDWAIRTWRDLNLSVSIWDMYEKTKTGGLVWQEDAEDFIVNSLYCEFACIANLDTGMLEFWCGFQKKPQEGNRYGTEPDERGYFPCCLAREYPLGQSMNVHEIVNEMKHLAFADDEE